MMEDRRQYRERWHFSKGIDIGHILTTVVIIMAVAVGWGNLQDQIRTNALNISYNKEMIVMQKELVQSLSKEHGERLVRIDEKLDRLIERSSKDGTK
jgi:hypothetical protein